MHGKESTRMVWRLGFNVAACLMLLCAAESRAGEGAQAPVPAGYPVVYPSVHEYEWTYHVAVMNVVEREYAVYAPAPTTHPVRWSYDGPVTRTERQKIGTYPEFTCKYFDFTVSNYCRTIWHDVYADLPYIDIRPQHVDVDVPVVRIEPQLFPVMYPQWTWKEVTLRIFLPAVSTAPVQLPTWSRSDDASMRLASSGPSRTRRRQRHRRQPRAMSPRRRRSRRPAPPWMRSARRRSRRWMRASVRWIRRSRPPSRLALTLRRWSPPMERAPISMRCARPCLSSGRANSLALIKSRWN